MYILTELLIVPLVIATNTSPSEINETDRDEDRLTYNYEKEHIIHENFIETAVRIKESVTKFN